MQNFQSVVLTLFFALPLCSQNHTDAFTRLEKQSGGRLGVAVLAEIGRIVVSTLQLPL